MTEATGHSLSPEELKQAVLGIWQSGHSAAADIFTPAINQALAEGYDMRAILTGLTLAAYTKLKDVADPETDCHQLFVQVADEAARLIDDHRKRKAN